MGKRIILLSIMLLCLFVLAVFYFRYQVHYSHGSLGKEKSFEIKKGEGGRQVGENLEAEGIISRKIYFSYYIWSGGLSGKILPGIYKLSGNMTIAEISQKITNEEDRFLKITFPEGWGSAKMAERLGENGYDKESFLSEVKNAEKYKSRYSFLSDPEIKTLEGFLFPDTYYFPPDADAENIINRLLANFRIKAADEAEKALAEKNSSLYRTVTMASIIEMEVKSDADRGVVSGLFWNRIERGQALQSCATLAYALGENKKQYSYEDTQVKSPYNTYLNPGLPPGPIGNPGFSAIWAAANPQDTDYFYFLSDPKTGKTIFSKTIDEHNANKAKYGL